MRKKLYCLLAVLTTLFVSHAYAQQSVKVTSSGIGYLEYLPQGYNSNNNNYPVVVSLHGIKEKGTSSTDPNRVKQDVPRVANVGLPKYVKYGQQYPFILISPQLKSNYGRWTGPFIMDVINHIKKNLRIDNRRIYLTGLSLGGGGVWSVAAANPSVFAAIVPICSGYNELKSACKLSSEDVATWAFHGDKDYVVSYGVSQKMVNAMNACASKPSPLAKFTIFPGMNHIIWDKVYKQTNALNWMLSITNGSAPASNTTSNSGPSVDAGSDKSITLPTNSVALQASASDSDGNIASYAWSKISGSTASLSGANTAKLTASKLLAGTYTFRLTVKDNKGASKYDDVKVTVKSSTTSSTTTTSTSNKLPVVSAGADKTITYPTKAITVVGSASDPDGSVVSYAWAKVSGPGASLSNTTSAKLWAYNLVGGTYVFRLTAKDNKGGIKSDEMTLVVNGSSTSASTPTNTTNTSASSSSNIAPTVTAGPDKTTTNKGFTLVGYASDKDGSIVSWSWSKVSGPSVSLNKANTSKLWAYNLVSGTYVFRLTVKDNNGATKYDDAKLTVNNGTTASTSNTSTSTSTSSTGTASTSNVAPTVTAGPDKTTSNAGFTVVGYASDKDGTIGSYSWTKVSGPSIGMKNTNTSKLWAYNLVPGTYVFRLTVKDNDGATRSDEAKLIVKSSSTASATHSSTSNVAPRVYAGADKMLVYPRRAITLVGKATDPDGRIVSYKWRKLSGGSMSMANAASPKLWVYNLKTGIYSFRMTAKDNDGVSRHDDVKLMVKSSTASLILKAPSYCIAMIERINGAQNNGMSFPEMFYEKKIRKAVAGFIGRDSAVSAVS